MASRTNLLNPLTPKRDWLVISPHSLNLESSVKVMGIEEMITNFEEAPDCQTNSPCQYQRNDK